MAAFLYQFTHYPVTYMRYSIPTFGNRYLSAIGGGKQRSRLAGWVQLSAEAADDPWPPRSTVSATLYRELWNGR